MRLLLVILLIISATPASAGEFSALGGLLWNHELDDSSAAWQLEYREGISENLAFSVSYLNEGHIPDHHRDGHTVSIWGRTSLLDGKLSLSAGSGPYFYFDTTAAKAGRSYTDDHGWGVISSMAATYYTNSRWLLEWRSNWVQTFDSISTFSSLIGIGYQLEMPEPASPGTTAPPRATKTTENELTIFGGRTIVNSFQSEESIAAAIEYRRGLRRYIDWTVGWLYEGDNRLIRRNGINSQLWGAKDFFGEQLELGAGAGAYFAVDQHSGERSHTRHHPRVVAGVVSLTSSYRFIPEMDIRTSWSRIVTGYDRDTDVLLAGIGYRF